MNLKRVEIGDTVRIYGYPGLFNVAPSTVDGCFLAEPHANPRGAWTQSELSVVARNGQPLPLLSCPIAPPAEDYPHEPTFDYTDGPAVNAADALKMWKAKRGA